jgi:hypothetical protein
MINEIENLLEMNDTKKARPSTAANKSKFVSESRGNRDKKLNSAVDVSQKREKTKETKCLATIDCLDYSPALDLLAFGGI